MAMNYSLISLSAVLLLASCAYATEKQIQDITVMTPGANDSICYVYVEGLRYRAHPPQTINISKSKEDLIVDCLAPGNRRQKIVVQPTVSSNGTWGNAATLGLGALWDYSSNAMFKYPDIITVDFTHAQIRPEEMPAQNNPDIKQPEEYMLEEFSPSRPRLNSDRYNMGTEIKRREKPVPLAPAYNESFISEPTAPVTDKGNLMPMALPPGLDPAGAALPTDTVPESSPAETADDSAPATVSETEDSSASAPTEVENPSGSFEPVIVPTDPLPLHPAE